MSKVFIAEVFNKLFINIRLRNVCWGSIFSSWQDWLCVIAIVWVANVAKDRVGWGW